MPLPLLIVPIIGAAVMAAGIAQSAGIAYYEHGEKVTELEAQRAAAAEKSTVVLGGAAAVVLASCCFFALTLALLAFAREDE